MRKIMTYDEAHAIQHINEIVAENYEPPTENQKDWEEVIGDWMHKNKIGIYTPGDLKLQDLIEGHKDKLEDFCQLVAHHVAEADHKNSTVLKQVDKLRNRIMESKNHSKMIMEMGRIEQTVAFKKAYNMQPDGEFMCYTDKENPFGVRINQDQYDALFDDFLDFHERNSR